MNGHDWAAKHGVVLLAEKIATHEVPCTPTGEMQTWRWAAITERGVFEYEDETDGSGSHDAFDRLFGVYRDMIPDPDELSHVFGVLGLDAVIELGRLMGWAGQI